MSKKTPSHVTIGGHTYFRFSGRLDSIHLQDGGSLCGKPSLSSNYASEKPHEKYCGVCAGMAFGEVGMFSKEECETYSEMARRHANNDIP